MVTETRGLNVLRVRLGTALQKHRLRRGLTQAQLAELADLSLKYVGEIERGEANTTLEALERLARAVDWDPMETMDGVREPVSEGVRILLIAEITQVLERFKMMLLWLEALNPAIHPAARRPTPKLPPGFPPPTGDPGPDFTPDQGALIVRQRRVRRRKI
jgi:transcriptional regulator with XRE-family HTH domain